MKKWPIMWRSHNNKQYTTEYLICETTLIVNKSANEYYLLYQSGFSIAKHYWVPKCEYSRDNKKAEWPMAQLMKVC